MNWVCEGAFDDHEWVSESTIPMQEEEVMGRELDHEICVSCVVQWCMLWFSAPARMNQTSEDEEINRKVPRSCGHGDCRSDLHAFWCFTHTANVHGDNGGCNFAQNTK